jgi:hypothetical protein
VPADDRTAAHISSPEWQSFETRMRARRADRCFHRAASAIENGSAEEAREALDEARLLNPVDPRLGELASRLIGLQPVGDSVVEPVTADQLELHPLAAPTLVEPASTLSIQAIPLETAAAPQAELDQESSADTENVADGAFEPMVELDRMRPPSLEGWSGLALAPPSREWNRTAGVVACGLLVSALAGWQAWTHKDLMAALPTAQPDIDATTGLAASPTRSAPVAAAIAPDAASGTEAAAQPDPKVVEESVPTASPGDAEVTLASDPKPIGSTGDNRPPATSATIPSEPAPAVGLANREAVVPATKPSYTPRRLEPIATPPVSDTRPTAASAPAMPATTDSLPAPLPSPVPAPPAVVSDIAPLTGSGNAGSSRTEPAPPLPSAPPSTPSPSPSSAPSSPSSSGSYAVRDQSAAVRAALNRYEAAYSRLDVAAVQSVWPSLDERALARAFDGLASQRVSLGSCSVNVNGIAARADCSGTAAWTPKVGGGEHITPRKWTFDLTESDGAWRIVRVQAR